MRWRVLKSGRSTEINQEKVDEANDFPQIHPGSSVRKLLQYHKQQQKIEL